MKKIFQSILTVLLSAGALGGIPCTAPLAYADASPSSVAPMTTIEINGTTWWSVEELLKFNQEVEAEKDLECGDNQDCRIEFGWSMIERGPKYSALSNLLEAQIWVTSVNPANETVKVLFFDDDMMLRHMGIEEKLSLEHLYMGWFDDWQGQIYNYDHDRFTNGSMPDSHPLYDSTMEDLSVIIPWEEVELSVAGGDLINNTSGKLDYAAFAAYNMFNAQGYFDYSNCLSDPFYQEGMECQMMISGDQWVSYFPPRELTITPEVNEPTQSTTDQENQNNPAESTPIESMLNPENLFSDIDIVTHDSNDSHATTSLSTLKAPETGKTMRPTTHSVEMPWWLIVLSILGALFIIWWFLPIRRKNHSKSQKSSKKVLTKKIDCDKMVSV